MRTAGKARHAMRTISILDNLKNKYTRLHHDKKLVAYKTEHFKLVIQFINYANWESLIS